MNDEKSRLDELPDENPHDIFADAMEVTPSDEALSRLARMAKTQLTLEAEAENFKERLRKVEHRLRQVSQEEIPEFMAEIGMQEFTLDSGQKITIKRTVKASIKADNKEAAHAWLRDNGHGSLIKNEVTVSFGRGEEEDATDFYTSCVENEMAVKQKESVHPQTLGAFVREQLEASESIPMDLLGVFELCETKITR